MSKTRETLRLEEALKAKSEAAGRYGCEEVTIGFEGSGHGDEIVDYMSMDAKGIFRCYELKVTLSDLKSQNRKSWYGDYNYLVVSDSLYHRVADWDELIPAHIGIIAGASLKEYRRASRVEVSGKTRKMLEDSLLRSICWRMQQLKLSADPEGMKMLRKKLQEAGEAFEAYRQKTDRDAWTLKDFERYYAYNHQLESYTIAEDAKVQRSQYFARKNHEMSWKAEGQERICPVCGKKSPDGICTPFCPWCGSDLRNLQ